MTPASLRTRLAVLGLAALAVSGACSNDKDTDAAARPKPTTTTSAAAAAPTLQFVLTETNDNGTKTPDEATVAAIEKTLDGWVANGVVAPLHSGAPAPDLAPYFTAAALER